MAKKVFDFSDAQKLIINAPIRDTLVSAAAGSGKTTVLVERIVQKIIKGEFELNQLLVVTFTKDAAGKMRLEIEESLRKKIAEFKSIGGMTSVVERLYNQLDMLPNCYIQTIDAFCSRVIREKGYVCADSKERELLESNTAILDENELSVILATAVKNAVADSYSEKKNNPDFLYLTNMGDDGRTDRNLMDALQANYKLLRSLPDYLNLCDRLVQKRVDSDLSGSVIGIDEVLDNVIRLFKQLNKEVLDNLRTTTEKIVFVKKDNDKKLESFSYLYDAVELYVSRVLDAYENRSNAFDVINVMKSKVLLEEFKPELFQSVSIRNNENDPNLLADFYAQFGKVAALFMFIHPLIDNWSTPTGYKKYSTYYVISDDYNLILTLSEEELLRRQMKRTAAIKEYVELIKKIDANYLLLKGRIHGMDFADQTHITKKILSTEEAQLYYASKFEEIYIDEYQDNSRIQDAIIDCFARDKGNVFRVGDVKQSIYKFRYAEPSMFISKLNDYKLIESPDEYNYEDSMLFLLNSNFRSDSTVINFVNHIFYSIMTESASEIDYDLKQQLNFPESKEEDKNSITSPRVVIVNKQNCGKEKEVTCNQVLKEVQRLVGSGSKLNDICVLSLTGRQASMIATELTENGYKAVFADELSIFEDQDIHSICNVIMAVGNLYRDEYLLGVLLSPYRFSNFTMNEIGQIIAFVNSKNSSMRKQNLIEKLRFYSDLNSTSDDSLSNRVRGFLDAMDSLRKDQIITDIAELVDRIYEITGITVTLKNETTKFVLFKDWICGSFLRYGSDISKIASELENMKIKLGTKTSVRSGNSSNVDSIKCMTYHGSKGLEFESVIVTETFFTKSKRNSTIVEFDSNNGFIMNDFIEDEIRIDPSVERIALNDRNRLASNAERLRLLYVALTRAKKNLTVVMPLALSSDKYNTLFHMVLNSNCSTYDRNHWLYGDENIEYAFLSALLKLKGAEELANVLKENFSPDGTSRIVPFDDFADFDLEIVEEELPEEDVTSESETTDSNSDDDETYVNDSVLEDNSGVNLMPVCAKSFAEDGKPIFEDYKYDSSSKAPFKLSVSEIKDGIIKDKLSLSLKLNDLEYYKQSVNGDVGDSPSEIGTFLHSIMRFIDFSVIRANNEDFEKEIDTLINEGIISSNDKDKAMKFKKGICSFANSELGAKLIESDKKGLAQYEKPVVFSVPAQISGDIVLVQGIIDLLFKVDDYFVMVDYKTDHFNPAYSSEDRAKEALKKHSKQVEYYASSVEKSGYKVKEKYLYLVNYGEFVCVSHGSL